MRSISHAQNDAGAACGTVLAVLIVYAAERASVARVESLQGTQRGSQYRLASSTQLPVTQCCLTTRWSGRVRDKVPSSYIGVRAAQLNR